SYAERTSTAVFTIKDSRLDPAGLQGGITALAGLGASPSSAGELWVITEKKLWRFINATWSGYELPHTPKEMRAAGRFLWLPADALPGDGPLAPTLFFSMGGREASGEVKPASFITLTDGPHTLLTTVRYPNDVLAARTLHFTLVTGASGTVSWATDIEPIFMA